MRRSGTWTAGSTSSTAAGTCGSAVSAKVRPAPAPEPCIPNPIPHLAAPLLTHAPPVHIQHTPKITPAASFTPPHSQAGDAGASLPVLFLLERRKGKKGGKGGREERRKEGSLLLVCACNKQDPTALTHRSRLAQTRRTKQQLGWAPQPTASAQSAFLGLGAVVGAQSHSFVLTGGSCQACRTGEDTSASWI